MRMPSHTALCSFVFSTILTSALIPSTGDVSLASAGAPAVQMAVQSVLNGLRGEGFAGGAQFALQAPAASPASAPAATGAAPGTTLTPELMSKMIQVIAQRGKDGEVDASIAGPLGLSAIDQNYRVHKYAAKSDDDPIVHGIAVSRGSDQDIVMYARREDGVHAFRAHRDGTVVAGLIAPGGNQITMIPPTAAQRELDAEIAFWSANIDSIIPGK